MHEVLVNRLGGLSLPRKSVVRLTDRPDMTLDVYRGRKTTIQLLQHWLTSLYLVFKQVFWFVFQNYKQGSHRPGKVLEFDLGPGKLLEFLKTAICPGIVLEFCKILLENYYRSLKTMIHG